MTHPTEINNAMSEDKLEQLKYGIDSITGEIIKPFGGIIDAIRNGGREYTYMTGSFGMAEFKRLVRVLDPLHCFDDLFNFQYLKPMENFETATIIDKICYHHARQSDIRTMKRLRSYVELENEFYYKY